MRLLRRCPFSRGSTLPAAAFSRTLSVSTFSSSSYSSQSQRSTAGPSPVHSPQDGRFAHQPRSRRANADRKSQQKKESTAVARTNLSRRNSPSRAKATDRRRNGRVGDGEAEDTGSDSSSELTGGVDRWLAGQLESRRESLNENRAEIEREEVARRLKDGSLVDLAKQKQQQQQHLEGHGDDGREKAGDGGGGGDDEQPQQLGSLDKLPREFVMDGTLYRFVGDDERPECVLFELGKDGARVEADLLLSEESDSSIGWGLARRYVEKQSKFDSVEFVREDSVVGGAVAEPSARAHHWYSRAESYTAFPRVLAAASFLGNAAEEAAAASSPFSLEGVSAVPSGGDTALAAAATTSSAAAAHAGGDAHAANAVRLFRSAGLHRLEAEIRFQLARESPDINNPHVRDYMAGTGADDVVDVDRVAPGLKAKLGSAPEGLEFALRDGRSLFRFLPPEHAIDVELRFFADDAKQTPAGTWLLRCRAGADDKLHVDQMSIVDAKAPRDGLSSVAAFEDACEPANLSTEFQDRLYAYLDLVGLDDRVAFLAKLCVSHHTSVREVPFLEALERLARVAGVNDK